MMGNYYWSSFGNYRGWNMMGWGMTWPFGFLLPFIFIDIVLKGIALYRAARRDEQWWFIALLVINSAGILPGIYLLTHKDSKKNRR